MLRNRRLCCIHLQRQVRLPEDKVSGIHTPAAASSAPPNAIDIACCLQL
jgi:hypothetical protein